MPVDSEALRRIGGIMFGIPKLNRIQLFDITTPTLEKQLDQPCQNHSIDCGLLKNLRIRALRQQLKALYNFSIDFVSLTLHNPNRGSQFKCL
jgi:hypothetical protein